MPSAFQTAQHGAYVDPGERVDLASRPAGAVQTAFASTPRLALVEDHAPAATDESDSGNGHAAVAVQAALATARHDSPTGGYLKFAMDLAIAGTALVLLAPLMVAVAVAIRFTGHGGPALYAHPRIGQGGRKFNCLKFRTMEVDGDRILERHLALNPAARQEWEATRKLTNDPRVTPLGHILRKTSIDELPQLLNVLRGEMSCVGPRPIVTAELPRYGIHARHYFKSRPGLTGLWQTRGRSSTDYRTRVVMDTHYVRKWSLMRDVAILAATIPAVLRFHDAK